MALDISYLLVFVSSYTILTPYITIKELVNI